MYFSNSHKYDPVQDEPLQPGDLVESYCTMYPAPGVTQELQLPQDGVYYFVREVIRPKYSRRPFLRFEELHNPKVTVDGEMAFSSQYFKKVDSANNKINI